jgi:hypothetical protein
MPPPLFTQLDRLLKGDDLGCDDANDVIGFGGTWLGSRARLGLRDRVSRFVVRMPRLRLKREEDTDPLIRRRERQQQCAVLPHAIVADELCHVPLVHVNVMNAVAGQEIEDLVARLRLGSPSLAERIDARVVFLDGALDEVLELIAEVVVRPRKAVRQQFHVEPVEEVRADEVEGLAARGVGKYLEPVGQRGKGSVHRMGEVVVNEEQQFRGTGL